MRRLHLPVDLCLPQDVDFEICRIAPSLVSSVFFLWLRMRKRQR